MDVLEKMVRGRYTVKASWTSATVTPILPRKERGLFTLDQCWYFSNEILRLTPQNDRYETTPAGADRRVR